MYVTHTTYRTSRIPHPRHAVAVHRVRNPITDGTGRMRRGGDLKLTAS